KRDEGIARSRFCFDCGFCLPVDVPAAAWYFFFMLGNFFARIAKGAKNMKKLLEQAKILIDMA
ncbi:MAG TPA: hypothetical protein PKK78_19155, partial [Kouleothrix sp.]|nr:hypothetical protein [Kouleothrix sp.]